MPHVGGRQPLAVGLDQDQADPAIAGLGLRVGLAHHRIEPGQPAVGDEGLGAVDDPLVAVPDGGGVHAGDVGAVVRFGEGAGREHPALGHRRQVCPLHFGAAPVQDDFRGETRQGDRAAHGRIAPAEFLDHQNVLQAPQPLPGKLFREMHADKAEITGLAPYFFGKFVFSFQFQHQVLVELPPGELPDRFLNILLGLVQLEIHMRLSSCRFRVADPATRDDRQHPRSPDRRHHDRPASTGSGFRDGVFF